ncbi:sugar transferase [Nostoc minutum NIES-26]|uniref:Sugar transferase n=1 Tax=Nostoc minutum NIES-26 TaxID=1844469 RepID=A0A367R226_9NOSO|nr:sugar transferase [Nostoc minutum NIES-26]
MTIAIIPPLQNYYTATPQHHNNRSPYCTLQWRQNQLWVKSSTEEKQPYLPSLDNEQLLVECLKHSPVKLVSIDPKLGEASLRFWARACEQAHKPTFLRTSSGNQLFKQSSQPLGWLQHTIDWIIALVLLLLVSPLMLGLVVLTQVYSPKSLFSYEWYVGEQGKLFRAIKFHTTANHNITPLGHWMCKYGLDGLPQLLNVLRSEMSLMSSRCWTLEDAIQLSLEGQHQLNKLPIIQNSWEVQTDSELLHLDSQTL